MDLENAEFSRLSLERDLTRLPDSRFDAFWRDKNHKPLPEGLTNAWSNVWVEVGAGSGDFFLTLAQKRPDVLFVPVERCRCRGKTLLRRAKKLALPNIRALRGNIVALLTFGVPAESIDRIYITYPCPWPKRSQRKNRWYLHPLMPHFIRSLKPGGLLLWSSDQAFYIREAQYVCTQKFGLESIFYGTLQPNPYNCLDWFPQGRTKFERTFLDNKQDCYELIVRKPQ